jgi:hypothetical protein
MREAVLINFDEYKLLLKKAELYEALIAKNSKPQEGKGQTLPQILANEAFNEGLLKPSTHKPSKNIFFLKFG